MVGKFVDRNPRVSRPELLMGGGYGGAGENKGGISKQKGGEKNKMKRRIKNERTGVYCQNKQGAAMLEGFLNQKT